ncbi:hypothetical protein Q0812_10400 [Brevundimonas sp. 2R-24]|uniref:Uncharacterized protein n=1 Tax=Peiella sedimenti TaxID=3061083 RepID=A0ABT8SMX7_9CAUL|nr:hypothetical protein [Caulobacteraceae bacterium XZ-24]
MLTSTHAAVELHYELYGDYPRQATTEELVAASEARNETVYQVNVPPEVLKQVRAWLTDRAAMLVTSSEPLSPFEEAFAVAFYRSEDAEAFGEWFEAKRLAHLSGGHGFTPAPPMNRQQRRAAARKAQPL